MEHTRIRLNEVEPGMVLARPVMDQSGRTLLPSGVVISDLLLNRLRQWKVFEVAVKVGRGPRGHRQPVVEAPRVDQRVTAVLRQETLTDAAETYRALVQDITSGTGPDVNTAFKLVDSLLGDVLASLGVVSALVTLKDADDYSYRHGVGTCLVAVTGAARMGYSPEQLRELGLVALLCDVGMTRVPREILNKSGRLTQEEWAEVRRHPEYSFEMIRSTEGVKLAVAESVLQHHERWDGSGYPRGLKGDAIHEYARLIALADAYDAITSGRPYSFARPPFLAAEDILALRGRHFDPELAEEFVTHLLNYEPGDMVELSDRRLATVVAKHAEAPTRPSVVPCDETGTVTGDMIDLRTEPYLYVLKLLGDPQL